MLYNMFLERLHCHAVIHNQITSSLKYNRPNYNVKLPHLCQVLARHILILRRAATIKKHIAACPSTFYMLLLTYTMDDWLD